MDKSFEVFNNQLGTSLNGEGVQAALRETTQFVPAVRPAPVSRGQFLPLEPESLEQSGLSHSDVEALVLKSLLNLGKATGRKLSAQLRLPFRMMQGVLHAMKVEMLIGYANQAPMSDYEYELTSSGAQRAGMCNQRCTYCGAAPVSLDEYIRSIELQSLKSCRPRLTEVIKAFDDLTIHPAMISQIGQAITAGSGLFLYGAPGNGKTSIARRIMRAANLPIWIPRTITVSGEIIRLYDPSQHEEVPQTDSGQLLQSSGVDRRWVCIRRPTVVVGGELTLEQLEITRNNATGINEAPLQLKSNCGALVVDDFGRQQVSITELLNRWIIPLENRYDYLNLPSGRQIQIPFDQLLVFATNLEPKELVDEAFLRRIPYKIEVADPTEEQFRDLLRREAGEAGIAHDEQAVDYLLEEYFNASGRSIRFCFARDLLAQIRCYCEFHERPLELTKESIEVAANNYFAGL